MPNPHFDVSIISRSGGHRGGRNTVASSAYRSGTVVSALAAASMMLGSSAVASASYRSGETLYDMRAEKTFDYRAKEDVVHTEIMTPEHAPVWASDRQMLWNQVEQVEKRKDAQLARDIIAALPRELNHEQQIALVREFVQTQFVGQGMCADIAIHDKLASDGKNQPHCHIMLTLRDVTNEGFAKKNREWNNRTLVSAWRDAWADTTNRHLEAAGRSERLSLESYAAQGIDKVPGEHMGAQAWNMEKKGKETGKGDKNREIEHANEVQELVKKYDRRDAPADAAPILDSILAEQKRIDAPLMASVLAEEGKANDSETDTASGVLRSGDRHSLEPDSLRRQEAGAGIDNRSTRPGGRASHEHASGSSQQDETGSKNQLTGGAFSDAELEAMHRASVRQVVRGLMRQSVHTIAEHFERVRRYGQQVMTISQDLARAVIDRITREQQRADRAVPPSRDSGLAGQAQREAERHSRERRQEERER